MARGNAKHSNGRLFRFLTGSPYRIEKAIFNWFAGHDRPGNQCGGGIRTWTVTAKNCSNSGEELLQPFFRNKKSQNPYLQTHVFLPHLSSSSDLRIVSSVQPSQETPNDQLSLRTKPSRIQRRYRPGFSPGFLFSCGAVTASTGTQTEYLLTNIE